MSNKRELIELILADLNRELAACAQSAKAAHEAATHEESKAEDQHDTRGLEASYLAGAQMARIETLRKMIAQFQRAEFRDFKTTDAVAIGALVGVVLDGKKMHYLLVSQGGGVSISHQGKTIQVITPQAPLGDALLDKKLGDVVELEVQNAVREYEIISVA
ncbi:MAG: GreA/GreB family elongation factor [Oligoflexia bacterium]|nr:GreA/GreB family elongation factor [Oligoflexia bacterium]